MIGLLQRCSEASVRVDGRVVAEIGPGLLVLVGVEAEDTEASARRLAERLVHYRVFSDAAQRMNRSLVELGGGLLLVPQFTLLADTSRGRRPSFSKAGDPAHSERLFGELASHASTLISQVHTGVFGADMQVSLTNDGPVTFWLHVS